VVELLLVDRRQLTRLDRDRGMQPLVCPLSEHVVTFAWIGIDPDRRLTQWTGGVQGRGVEPADLI
jgi:hypothetical protein